MLYLTLLLSCKHQFLQLTYYSTLYLHAFLKSSRLWSHSLQSCKCFVHWIANVTAKDQIPSVPYMRAGCNKSIWQKLCVWQILRKMTHIFKKLCKGCTQQVWKTNEKLCIKPQNILFLNWIQDLEYILLYIWKGTLMNAFAVRVHNIWPEDDGWWN